MTIYAVPPLLIQPRRSWRLAGWIATTHALALGVIATFPLDLTTILLATAVVICAVHALRQHVLRCTARSIHSALWRSDQRWQLTWQSGATSVAQLTPATFISQPLIVLNFQLGWRRVALPLFGDALDPDTQRHLRQRLRQVVDSTAISADN
ncbi:hypothetical protein CKO12_08770 [Chromatium okenii]|uniref:protein YgfX n=1 Tax=Chromatium okenii TaxID=61644 RepID=UPI001906109D|nr:protein YgfX [Chromatium okenii]MBK1641960.1 hypothetical protein [Chromatium okenii]